MPSSPYSLKKRLFKQIVAGMTFITLVSLVGIYLDTRHEVEELFDASLAQTSRVLLGILHPETIVENRHSLDRSLDIHDINFDLFDEEATPYGHKYEKKLAFQVWDNNKQLLLKSASVGSQPMNELKPGFSYRKIDNFNWRIFVLYSDHSEIWLIVGERDDIRGELTHKIAFNHIIPVLVVIPILAWLIWLTVHRAIKPLQTVVEHVNQQNYEKLEKVNRADLPYEVGCITQAINHLFQRLNKSYQREKRFISDVAHELRNPLAALTIHNDNALAENNNEQLSDILSQMRRGVTRLSHLVGQLLALSRADREIHSDEFVTLNLNEIFQQLQQQYKETATRKEQELNFKLDNTPLVISGIEVLISSLLGNLLDNAIRYSPEQSQIEVEVSQSGQGILIVVEDSGPGIPDELKQRAQDRFYRIPGSKQMGSGLGLSIVRRIAEVHQAKFELGDASMGGLRVEVSFPTR